jgi:hypothetical protein
VTRYAAAFGRDWGAVWHTTPLVTVLAACWCLDDDARRSQLRAEAAALHSAYLTNYAVNDPKLLEKAARAHTAALRRGVADTGPSPALLDARAQLRAQGLLPDEA